MNFAMKHRFHLNLLLYREVGQNSISDYIVTNGCQAVTLGLPLNAASVVKPITSKIEFVFSIMKAVLRKT